MLGLPSVRTFVRPPTESVFGEPGDHASGETGFPGSAVVTSSRRFKGASAPLWPMTRCSKPGALCVCAAPVDAPRSLSTHRALRPRPLAIGHPAGCSRCAAGLSPLSRLPSSNEGRYGPSSVVAAPSGRRPQSLNLRRSLGVAVASGLSRRTSTSSGVAPRRSGVFIIGACESDTRALEGTLVQKATTCCCDCLSCAVMRVSGAGLPWRLAAHGGPHPRSTLRVRLVSPPTSEAEPWSGQATKGKGVAPVVNTGTPGWVPVVPAVRGCRLRKVSVAEPIPVRGV